MSLYLTVKEKILQNKQNRLEGKYNGISFPLKRLSDYVPVIEKGQSIGILGQTGSGKSKFGRWIGLYHSYMFAKQNNYPLKIIIFALEDDVIKVYKNIICHYLWELYNIKISLSELDSKGDRVLPDFVVDKLNEAETFFSDFENTVTIINGIFEPKKIYEVLEKHANLTGKEVPYTVTIDGRKREQVRYESDYHTVVLLDNLANIDEGEEHANERLAIVDLCKKYIRERCCNFYNFTVIQIMQNDFSSERQAFNTSGKSIFAKVEPSLASVGEAKTVTRSMHLVISLFNPSKFDMLRYPEVKDNEAHRSYDIEILGNRFRAIKVLKNNDGDSNIRIGVMFDAFSETWEELPLPDSAEMKQIYEKITGKKFQKTKNILEFEDSEPPF